MTRLDEQAGTAAQAGAENILPDRRGVFEYQPWKADQVDALPALQLVAALRHKKPDGQLEPIWLQTFADAPDACYVLEEKTGRSGKPYTVKKWCLTGVPKEGGKVSRVQGQAERWGAVSLDELAGSPYLQANMARCGVFFAVNVLAEDAPRRKAEHVARVAAVFLDLDGAPMPASFPLQPTATVESSAGRHHVYWAVDGVPLDEFRVIQQTLARLYGADTQVCDLPRVMRLPGYFHGKKELGELVMLTSITPEAQYTRADLLEAWPELVDALAAAEAERERQRQDAERRQVEADQLRQQISSGTAGNRAEVMRKYGQVGLLGCCADLLAAGEGTRNHTLNAVAYRAGRLVGAGVLDEAEAVAELRAVAERVGLEAGEITTTLHSGLEAGKEKPVDAGKVAQFVGVKRTRVQVERLEPAQPTPQPTGKAVRYRLPTFPKGTQEGTDEANAVILAENGLSARLRYSMGLGWLVYQAERGVWVRDPEQVLAAQVAGQVLREVVGQYFADAIKQRADEDELKRIGKWAASVCTNGTVWGALRAAGGKPQFLTPVEAWDGRPDLLNCRNGVLDLRAGELLPHDPEHLMTWQAGAAYDPEAQHPYVGQLIELLQADGRHDFLQRSVGSTLYGEAPNEALTVLEGEGRTGKGTLVTGITAMLGDYAHTTEVELLLQSSRGESGGGPKPELLELRGKRLVVAGEPPKGARFNAGRVKGMTGNDPITARTLHSPVLVTFTPVFKLWIHTNYPIGAAHDDSGLQRRLRVVPFAAKPARPDPRFKQTLKDDPAARSALLNWAYEGFRAWYAEGYALGESEAVERATGGYWKDQNPYEKFATENLDFDPDSEIFSARLKTMFEDWAEDNGAKLGRSVKLADLHEYLRKHGCEAVKGAKGARKWVGVSERDLPTPTDEQTSAAGGAGGAGGGTSPVFSTYARRDEKNWGNGATSATSATRDDIAPSGQPSGWEGDEL